MTEEASGAPGPGSDGGATIRDALDLFAERGYRAGLHVNEDGGLQCLACRQTALPRHFAVHDLYRIEGASDPDDEAIVAAVQCPGCKALGAAVFAYGPHASAEEMLALGDLERHDPAAASHVQPRTE